MSLYCVPVRWGFELSSELTLVASNERWPPDPVMAFEWRLNTLCWKSLKDWLTWWMAFISISWTKNYYLHSMAQLLLLQIHFANWLMLISTRFLSQYKQPCITASLGTQNKPSHWCTQQAGRPFQPSSTQGNGVRITVDYLDFSTFQRTPVSNQLG